MKITDERETKNKQTNKQKQLELALSIILKKR